MRGKGFSLIVAIALAAGATPALACADGSCEAHWRLDEREYSCAGRAILSPANDTRINLLMLLADRAGKGPVAQPKPDWDTADFGTTFLGWATMRSAFYPPAEGAEEQNGYLSGSRCDSIAAGAAAFAAAVEASGIPADERTALIAARSRLEAACGTRPDIERYRRDDNPAPATLPAWPQPASAKGRAFLAYLQAAEAFYAGDWGRARDGFATLRSAGDPWLAETALYMLARVELNAAIAPALGEYGNFDRAKVDFAAATQAGRALEAYFKRYRSGRYDGSARGLVRRALWLNGDQAALAAEYRGLMTRTDVAQPATAELIEEIDTKLLGGPIDSAKVSDPLLLAAHFLAAMRSDGYFPNGDARPKLALADLEAARPAFAGQDQLYGLLLASHAYYVAEDPRRALALLPDDARQPRYGAVAFSRQVLRGMALAAVGDRNEAGFWRELIGGANAPWQRSLVELGLALHHEKANQVNAVFAKGSPIQDPTIRQTLLYNSAGPALLRQQARDAAAPRRERDVALFVLLRKQLERGRYADFVSDAALVPRDASTDGSYGEPADDRGTALGLFVHGKASDGYPCPALLDTARTLAANPRDVKARLCLGDFWRLNGFDGYGRYDADPQAGDLGTLAKGFAGPVTTRGSFYRAIIADPAAPGPDKAYALYRAVMCYAPSGYNDCGDEPVEQSQRGQWFRQLKRDYPTSPWAKKLKVYW